MPENEQDLLSTTPSMFRNHPIWFVVCCMICLAGLVVAAYFHAKWWVIGGLCATGLGLFSLLIWFLDVKAMRLTVTDLRTTLHKGLLSRSITEVWHKDVRNVQLHQTFLQRVLGVGRIAVSSAGQSGIEIDVSGLSDPDDIKALIDKHRVRANEDDDDEGE